MSKAFCCHHQKGGRKDVDQNYNHRGSVSQEGLERILLVPLAAVIRKHQIFSVIGRIASYTSFCGFYFLRGNLLLMKLIEINLGKLKEGDSSMLLATETEHHTVSFELGGQQLVVIGI